MSLNFFLHSQNQLVCMPCLVWTVCVQSHCITFETLKTFSLVFGGWRRGLLSRLYQNMACGDLLTHKASHLRLSAVCNITHMLILRGCWLERVPPLPHYICVFYLCVPSVDCHRGMIIIVLSTKDCFHFVQYLPV